jgi:oligopeptidase B
MKYLIYVVCTLLFACKTTPDQTELKPPVANKVPKAFNEHSGTRLDEYFWMNDPKDTAVINHLKAENAYYERWGRLCRKRNHYIF